MAWQITRRMEGLNKENINFLGQLNSNWDVLSPFQAKCVEKLAHKIQLEEEAYLIKHSEVMGMLKLLVREVLNQNRRKNIPEFAGRLFTKPYKELEQKIRMILKSPPEGPFSQAEYVNCGFEATDLEAELLETVVEFNPLTLDIPPSTSTEMSNTTSSSFISLISSSTTQPTPEPIPTPEPTTSEIFMKMVVNCMDKATASKLTDEIVKYDTAYVEVIKIVELAMEIPVLGVREDIANLLATAYAIFDDIQDEKAKIAADIAWDRRMRKKMKKSIRRQENFRGYETPSTPKSGLPSSHESNRIPPPRPCKCHPKWTYNRYPKDRFGIYLPRTEEYELTSITLSPAVSTTVLVEPEKEL